MFKNSSQQMEMYSWFHSNFKVPELCDVSQSGSMGYQHKCGGPYFADEILHKMYDKVFPEKLVKEVVDALDNESIEWTKIAH